MKLKEYAKKLSKLAEKYPNAIVVYGYDDEGNGYQEVNFIPTAGSYMQFRGKTKEAR